MPLVPRALRPSAVIRRKALYSGILGSSRVWRMVAVWVFGKSTIKKFFGKNVEVLDVVELGPGRFVSVETSKPISRRKVRRLARAGTPTPSRKELTAAATALALATVAGRRRR